MGLSNDVVLNTPLPSRIPASTFDKILLTDIKSQNNNYPVPVSRMQTAVLRNKSAAPLLVSIFPPDSNNSYISFVSPFSEKVISIPANSDTIKLTNLSDSPVPFPDIDQFKYKFPILDGYILISSVDSGAFVSEVETYTPDGGLYSPFAGTIAAATILTIAPSTGGLFVQPATLTGVDFINAGTVDLNLYVANKGNGFPSAPSFGPSDTAASFITVPAGFPYNVDTPALEEYMVQIVNTSATVAGKYSIVLWGT